MAKFTTKEEVDKYFSGDRIKCLICGKWLKAIGGQHLKTHGLSGEEYKTMFGLPQSKGLVCDETAEKQGIAIMARMEAGEPGIGLTPETVNKGQYKSKHGHPPYQLNDMKAYAEMGRETLMARAEERAASIDWDMILEEMKEQGVAFWSLKISIGDKPSSYDLERKKQNDATFAREYDAIVEQQKKYAMLKDKVIELTREGFKQREIAIALGTSKTHVARMQRIFKVK